MGRVVVLGASLMDMNMRLERLPVPGETRLGRSFFTMPGGKGANQAVAARRAGADVAFVTAIGGDANGRAIRDNLFGEGIDLRHASVIEGESSGVALILVGDDGENLIGVAMGANARVDASLIDGLPEEIFRGPGVFLASLEVPLPAVARAVERARAGGLIVILNPAPAVSGLVESGLLPQVDILTPNRGEAEALTSLTNATRVEASHLAESIRTGRGPGAVVMTLGSAGCLIAEDSGTLAIPAYPVEAVDTVGAGDAFTANLAAALADGRSLAEAARRANAAAAQAATRPGAQGALPTREAVDRLMAQHGNVGPT
ncbi:ribokinase [Tundrisphaera sp. TA3]|uniref:ribokinase n=1 Tax=Tundrisphaera sp. TA3 TaxID=3435775 RepID=UPI003EBECA61